MILALSSALEATRMWRSMDRAILEKKPSTRLSHEPCFGVNTKEKRPCWLTGDPGLRFLGNMGRVVVEDQLDGGSRWVGCIELLEEADELARAMAVLDAGMHLPGEQIDAGQQAQCAMTLVFVVPRKGRMRRRVVVAGRVQCCRSLGCRAFRRTR